MGTSHTPLKTTQRLAGRTLYSILTAPTPYFAALRVVLETWCQVCACPPSGCAQVPLVCVSNYFRNNTTQIRTQNINTRVHRHPSSITFCTASRAEVQPPWKRGMRARSRGRLFDFPAAANILLRLALAPTYALHSGHVWRRSCIIHVLRQFAWKLCPHKVVPKSSLPESSQRQIGQRSSSSLFGGSFRSTVFVSFITRLLC